jgi:hypothetical protein
MITSDKRTREITSWIAMETTTFEEKKKALFTSEI